MNNLLLVAGTNRNVGKTTFCCKAIKQLAKRQEVWAIKITPHFHKSCDTCKILFQKDNLMISQELSDNPINDSAKMLAAGATKVIFIQGADDEMKSVAIWIGKNIPLNIPVVCESAALREHIMPGKFVILSHSQKIDKHKDLIPSADLLISDFKYNIESLNYSKNLWLGI